MNDKLIAIQQELKAPKDLNNSFGGYKYRSAEAILEAVKPLLKKYELSIALWDEVVCVGSWNYVQASVELTDNDGHKAGSKAFAREQEVKKGMDAAQITGAASSYARKYALNGLFAIDDTKDPDTDEHHQTTHQPTSRPKNTDLAKAKQAVVMRMRQKQLSTEDMIAAIQRVLGKDSVDTIEEASTVLSALGEA